MAAKLGETAVQVYDSLPCYISDSPFKYQYLAYLAKVANHFVYYKRISEQF